ncbi:hypothetical protein ACFPVT_02320 [Corynebacterium choanae]|uniref:hypothetical protein n=1 Tax=Corynebacterium choanae TaxID=1862358 RepID=UPI0013DDADE6|nr:hypothetical protein [Corynebacterium choanae]
MSILQPWAETALAGRAAGTTRTLSKVVAPSENPINDQKVDDGVSSMITYALGRRP